MFALSIQPAFPNFSGSDGLPLENGYIWIGAANLDPEGNPINVYWDAAFTIAAPQPIRTLNGYASRNGTPANIYVNSDYSIRVQDSKGSVIYSDLFASAFVTTSMLADGAVTTPKIADINVTTAKLADGAVTTAKITDANVTTPKIADANVTAAKLAAGAAVSNLGFTPVQQGGGTGQLSNKVYIGWSAGSQLFLQVDTTDFGQVWPITPAALSTASGSAPSYSARAWVNFNGTGTVAIRASANVSSITDNGTGDYTVNFATAMSDADYALSGVCHRSVGPLIFCGNSGVTQTTTLAGVQTRLLGSTISTADADFVSVAVHR